MGNVNNVCTDKTGTLTEGVMKVSAFFIEGQDIRLDNNKINDENLRDLVWRCIFKNITCVETVNDKGEKVLNGDMTEKALYTYLNEGQYSLEGDRKGIYVLPFKSDYKYMMNIYKENDEFILYAKGAPERVGEFLTKFRVKGGEEEEFEQHKDELFNAQENYAQDSMRTLLFGYKKLTEEEINNAKEEHPDDDLGMFQQLAKDYASLSWLVSEMDIEKMSQKLLENAIMLVLLLEWLLVITLILLLPFQKMLESFNKAKYQNAKDLLNTTENKFKRMEKKLKEVFKMEKTQWL